MYLSPYHLFDSSCQYFLGPVLFFPFSQETVFLFIISVLCREEYRETFSKNTIMDKERTVTQIENLKIQLFSFKRLLLNYILTRLH